MNKFLIVLVVAVISALVLTPAVSANGGPHGGFTPTTDACAGCHRTHTATSPGLLVAATTTYEHCMTCHGTNGTGADTNVQDGKFTATRSASTEGEANTANNANLLGGGFDFYKGVATTSSHSVTGTTAAAWGNGVNRGLTANITGGNLDCASCHDPHGSPNYRILHTSINGRAVSVGQVDEGAKDYDTEKWGAGQSSLCAACHNSYHQTIAGSGSSAAVAATGGYAHRVDMSYSYNGNLNPETTGLGGFFLPLAETGTNNTVVCQTCHLPHGSSSVMSGFANGGPLGNQTLPGNTTATDSALLRLDNRAVCQVCHQKTGN